MTTPRLPSRLSRFWRCRAGTTAIEFAIVGPVLFLTLGVIIETGLFLFFQFNLQYATDLAARQIRIGTVGPLTSTSTPDQMNIDDFKNLVCQKLPLPNCTTRIRVDVRHEASFAALSAIMPNPPQNVGAQTPSGAYVESYSPGTRGDAGSLIVTYDWRFSFGFVGSFFHNVPTYPGIWRMYGVSVYRNEM